MTHDAVVVGAGPNGLGAAIELQRNGLSVLLIEANDVVGGAARSEEVTLPGFVHDAGSAVYPLGIGSPLFSELPLDDFGLHWIQPDVPVAHPLGSDRTVLLHRSLSETAVALGADEGAYHRFVQPFVERWPSFVRHVLGSPFARPSDPGLMLRFAPNALRPTTGLATRFTTSEGRALLAGNAAHAGTPLEHRLTGAVATTLMAAGHAVGWPLPRGGSGRLTAALAEYFTSLGGTVETGRPIRGLEELPGTRATILALTPRQVREIAGDRLPERYRRTGGTWHYGPGAFKVDWALDAPIPWSDPDVARAGTVHVGGTLEEIAASEGEPWRGRVSDRPFVLLAQPTLFDPSRAPPGKHIAWGYCHVPNGWNGDATDAIERQVERFAPGFRDCILSRAIWNPRRLEDWDANLVGGDVNGGALTVRQMLGPGRWAVPGWKTGTRDLYACSASTPPGGGVHGMAGYHAARTALKSTFGIAG